MVGINDYPPESHLPPLQYAGNDARDIRAILETEFGFSAADIRYLSDKAATKFNVSNALSAWLAQENAGQDDCVLFFFAGHGFHNQQDDASYIALADSDSEAPDTCLSVAQLKSSLSTLPVRHKALILACCYSGNLFKTDTTSPSMPGPARPASTLTRGDPFVEVGDSLAYYIGQPAFLGLSAGRNTPISDGSPGVDQHSVFVREFLQVLKDRANSPRADHAFTFRQLAAEVEVRVANVMQRAEIPNWGRLGPGDGDIVFFPPSPDPRKTPRELSEIERVKAESRRLAAIVLDPSLRDPELKALLAVHALELDREQGGVAFNETLGALRNATQAAGYGFRSSLPDPPPHVLCVDAAAKAPFAFAAGGDPNDRAKGDYAIRVWDLTHGVPTKPVVLKGHESPVTSLASSPDGAVLFSGDQTGHVLRWQRTANGEWEPSQTVLTRDTPIGGLAFSHPDRLFVATGSFVRVIDAAVLQELLPPFELNLAKLPDGTPGQDWGCTVLTATDKWIAAGVAGDRTVQLWDRQTPGPPRVLGPYVRRPLCLAINRSNNLIAIGIACDSSDGMLLFEPLSEGVAVPESPRKRSDGPVSGLAWKGDDLLIRTGSEFLSWNARTQTTEKPEMEYFGPGLALCDNGKAVVTSSDIGVSIRDFSRPDPFPYPTTLIPGPRGSLIGSIGCSDDQSIIGVAGTGCIYGRDADHGLQLYSGKQLSDLRFGAVAVSPERIAGVASGHIFIWDRLHPSGYQAIRVGEDVRGMKFVGDGTTLLTRCSHLVEHWSISPSSKPEVLLEIKDEDPQPVFDDDLSIAAVQSADAIRLFAPERPQTSLGSLPGLKARLLGLATSRDLSTVVLIATADDNTTSQFSPAEQLYIVRNRAGEWKYERTVRPAQPFDSDMVALSGDGTLLVCGSSHNAWLWDLSLPMCEAAELFNREGCTLVDLAFSPDGEVLLTAGHQCGVEAWPTHRGMQSYIKSRVVRDLTEQEGQRYLLIPPKPRVETQPRVAARPPRDYLKEDERRRAVQVDAYLCAAAIYHDDRDTYDRLLKSMVDRLNGEPLLEPADAVGPAFEAFRIVGKAVVKAGRDRESLKLVQQTLVEPFASRATNSFGDFRGLPGQIELLLLPPDALGRALPTGRVEEQVSALLAAARLARNFEMEDMEEALWREAVVRNDRVLEQRRVAERRTEKESRAHLTTESYVIANLCDRPGRETCLKSLTDVMHQYTSSDDALLNGLESQYAQQLARQGEWSRANEVLQEVNPYRWPELLDRARLGYVEHLCESGHVDQAEKEVSEIGSSFFSVPARVCVCVAYARLGSTEANKRSVEELLAFTRADALREATGGKLSDYRHRLTLWARSELASKYAEARLASYARDALSILLMESSPDELLRGPAAGLTRPALERTIGGIAEHLSPQDVDPWVGSLPTDLRPLARARVELAEAMRKRQP